MDRSAGTMRYTQAKVSLLGNTADLVFKTKSLGPSKIRRDSIAYSCNSATHSPQNELLNRITFCSRCYISGSSPQEYKSTFDAFEEMRKNIELVSINLHLLESDDVSTPINFGLVLAIMDICKLIFPQIGGDLSSFDVHARSKRYRVENQSLSTPEQALVLLEQHSPISEGSSSF